MRSFLQALGEEEAAGGRLSCLSVLRAFCIHWLREDGCAVFGFQFHFNFFCVCLSLNIQSITVAGSVCVTKNSPGIS